MAQVTKDSNGTTLVSQQLIMLDYRRLTNLGPALAVFKEIDTSNTLTYYPLTEVGLTQIKFELGEYDDGEEGTFRKEAFQITKIKANNMIIVPSSSLSAEDVTLYSSIISRM